MRNQTKKKNGSLRYPTLMKGLYSLGDKQEERKDCTIINVILNGTGLEFYTVEKINKKTKLSLEIFTPDGDEPVTVEGKIQWTKQGRKDFVCGIKLTERLNDSKMETLIL